MPAFSSLRNNLPVCERKTRRPAAAVAETAPSGGSHTLGPDEDVKGAVTGFLGVSLMN